FQMTNGSIGQAANDGFLIDVDQTGIVALRQQERNVPMQFWNMDARLG
ncbi:MAG: hypothetical protein JNL88_06600, partial [Bacteroidia bacterium]|nr:hypothetical protein [Bacteroidia bacterium]